MGHVSITFFLKGLNQVKKFNVFGPLPLTNFLYFDGVPNIVHDKIRGPRTDTVTANITQH